MEIERLKQDLEDAETYISKLAENEQSKEGATAEVNKLRDHLNRAQIDLDAVMKERDALHIEIQELTDAFEGLEKERAQLIKQKTSAGEMSAEQAKLQQLTAQQKAEIEKYQQQIKLLQADMGKLDNQMKRMEVENKELKGKLEKSLEALTKFQKKIEESANDLVKSNELNRTLKADLNKLQQQQIQQAEEFNHIQQQTFEQHKAELMAASANSGSDAKLIEEINKLKGELERQRQETQKWMNESNQLRIQLNRAQEEIKSFSVERERFQNQLERIVTELEQKEVNILVKYYLSGRAAGRCYDFMGSIMGLLSQMFAFRICLSSFKLKLLT